MEPKSARDRAVVLGGGLAAMLAARVLAGHYARVTIVERDRYPVGPDHRRGVPQGHHAHALLPLGQRILEDLLPGLTAELTARGALDGDVLGNARWYLPGGMLRQAQTGLLALSATRPLIEDAIRARVLAHPNVTAVEGYDVIGPRPSADGSRVVGARISSRYGEGSRVVPAELVVDATGRGSRLPLQLAEFGRQAPPEESVTIDLAYATRLFELPPDLLGDDIAVITSRRPGYRRSGILQRVEGDRILVTLAGTLGERPPLDLDGFLEYAASLPVPDTHDLIRRARPVDDAKSYRFPGYVWRRYERLPDFPAGLFAVGDSVCNFNPVYGQGISVAAAGAFVLRDELTNDDEPQPTRYFQKLAQTIGAPWALAVGADMATIGTSTVDGFGAGTGGPRPPISPEYVAALQAAAVDDAELATAFIRVTSLVDPPTALLSPEVVARVAHAVPVA